jgi:hypothetical protein
VNQAVLRREQDYENPGFQAKAGLKRGTGIGKQLLGVDPDTILLALGELDQ